MALNIVCNQSKSGSHSKAQNPQLLPRRCSVGCPLLQVCVHLDESVIYPWLYQYGSRRPIETGAEARRMDASPRCGEENLESVMPGSGGPLCYSGCPLWYSLVHTAPLGLDAMVQTWLRLRLCDFPPIALLPEVLARVRRDEVSLLLVAPFWPGRVWFSDLISLLDGSPWEIPIRRISFHKTRLLRPYSNPEFPQ